MKIAGIATMVVVLALAALTGHTMSTQARVERDLHALQARVIAAEQDAESLRSGFGEMPVSINTARVVERAQPSVFRVEVGGNQGSGFVIERTAEGSHLLTSYHVVAEAWTSYQREVRLASEDATGVATIVAVDMEADLALLETEESWPELESASSLPEAGAEVVALGSPLGLEGTVTVGVVSGSREGFLQLSAPVSPGSSGGPVLDAAGEVVGVVAWKFAETDVEGLTFAVPIDKACEKVLRC